MAARFRLVKYSNLPRIHDNKEFMIFGSVSKADILTQYVLSNRDNHYTPSNLGDNFQTNPSINDVPY